MDDAVHLSFTVGPVQGFVAQARRTRDLWAGSWLLSYLTECALAAAEKTCKKVLIPARNKEQHGKIASVRTMVGGMPNRFELYFESEEAATKAAGAAKEAFMDAWRRVADAVWEQFVEPAAAQGNDTRRIWDRQVDGFWELSWVVGIPSDPDLTIGGPAAARKQFRNVPAAQEPGMKCSLMGALQEVSGHFGGQQKEFWSILRKGKGLGAHDLGDGERLCAIALIKRLFPHVVKQALGENAVHADLDQLQYQTAWPSTAFFAALPWLKGLNGEAREKAEAFATAAGTTKVGAGEKQSAKDAGIPWANIDAPAWFSSALRQKEWDIEETKQKELLNQLDDICKHAGDKAPIPYYALLLMDGDSMGALLRQLGEPQKLSECLGNFSDKVSGIVRKRDGRTIYAGGDDVLAMLPAKGALEAADELAQAYSASFNGLKEATLSGAVVFAHWKFPLRQALATAHRLLVDVAKEQTGRDSLAVGILQGSGLNTIWSAPWAVVRGKEDGVPRLMSILDRFGSDDTDHESTRFNASYLYHLREQFRRLFPDFREEPGKFGRFDGVQHILLGIAHAEFRRRMKKDERSKQAPEQSKLAIEQLMALSRSWRREKRWEKGELESCPEEHSFSFDAWRVARFLKQIEDGKMAGHE